MIGAFGPELSRRFDGTNEVEVSRWYRQNYGAGPTSQADHFVLGVVSEAENRTVSAGLSQVVMDHLVDAVDRDGTTELQLRSGATLAIDPDSWLVNCTGYLTDTDVPYEPYTSADGSVLSIQTRSATMHLTSYAGYFMTHLMFLGKLRDIPLYELDLQQLWRQSKAPLPYAMFTLVQYNLSLVADQVPTKLFTECGVDFNRWYPWHRRTAAGLRFVRTHRRERDHLRATLDTLRERFDIRCGPLDSVVRASEVAAG